MIILYEHIWYETVSIVTDLQTEYWSKEPQDSQDAQNSLNFFWSWQDMGLEARTSSNILIDYFWESVLFKGLAELFGL